MMGHTGFPRRPKVAMPQALLAKRPAAVARPPLPLNAQLLADLDKPHTLPHLSDTILKAMTIANDPHSTLADMAALITRDTLLTAGVLKIANSPVYGGTAGTSDVRLAVNRLGLRGCANLISSIGLTGLYKKHPLPVRVACETVLRHSLFAAVLAAAVNKVLRLPLGGEEFTGALLHDIGRLVICVKAPDHYAAAGLSNFDESENVLADERKAYGTDHCAVGGLFALKNNLPKPLGRAISNHHTPARETEHRDLVGLVAFADGLANHIQSQHNVQKFDLDKALAAADVGRRLDRDRVQSLRDKLPGIAVEAVREARRMMKCVA